MASLIPSPKFQFFDANGNPLVGGRLYTYSAGTLIPLTTYVDKEQTAANTNPVILDSRGEASVWLLAESYKFILKDANDVEIWTVDNLFTDAALTVFTYTATATGMTTTPTGTVKYSVVGNVVTLDIPAITGTSNSTAFTLTGGPVAIRPTADKDVLISITDNGTGALGIARIKTTGVIELYSSVSGGAFTSSGTKAVRANSITYTLA